MTKTHILVDLQSFRHLLAPTFNNDRHALCEEPPSIMEFKVRYKLCKLSEIVNPILQHCAFHQFEQEAYVHRTPESNPRL